jgi:hypothetical protein
MTAKAAKVAYLQYFSYYENSSRNLKIAKTAVRILAPNAALVEVRPFMPAAMIHRVGIHTTRRPSCQLS